MPIIRGMSHGDIDGPRGKNICSYLLVSVHGRALQVGDGDTAK